MNNFLKVSILSFGFLLNGCEMSHQVFDQAEYEKKLRLMCPCVMFSEEQREIFKSMLPLDYFVIVPASGVGTQDAIRLEKSTTFGIKVSDSCLINKHILDAADTDENRFKRFRNAMHTEHKILWSLRGGYGSYRLISFLEKLPKPKHKKIFIGFSDTTAVSLFISQNWKNWEVIHAPVFTHLVNFHFYKPNFELLMQILHGTIEKYDITGLKPLNEAARCTEKISGKITGGNLTLLETSLSTSWEVQTKGKIVFIEDVGEISGSIYRLLYHLKLAGKFISARAIVFGSFVKADKEVNHCIKKFAEGENTPVFVTDQFGHGKVNMPIVYNADSFIQNDKLTIKLPKNWNRWW